MSLNKTLQMDPHVSCSDHFVTVLHRRCSKYLWIWEGFSKCRPVFAVSLNQIKLVSQKTRVLHNKIWSGKYSHALSKFLFDSLAPLHPSGHRCYADTYSCGCTRFINSCLLTLALFLFVSFLHLILHRSIKLTFFDSNPTTFCLLLIVCLLLRHILRTKTTWTKANFEKQARLALTIVSFWQM